MAAGECPVYRPEEVAELLDVSVSTVIRACDEGELDCIKLRSTRRIPRVSIDSRLRLAGGEAS